MLTNLDANIVINLLDTTKDTSQVESLIESEIVCVTPITVHITWYFWEKGYIKCPQTRLLEFFDSVEILPMSKNSYQKALTISKLEDIEDAMPVACCLDNRVDKIITSDGGLYAKYAKLLQIVLIPNPK